ncbi:alanine racemase [Neomegalonema sp.]|uniref:alanine racemase n=1 Tax=Neomegalonema sp. TaxID=2039713 RepID=UPI00260A81A9|nr:alanine racemase [Neomegalonema sp.]MDD2869259.1 alanine racemase [Neomegalonema sp.]
MSQEAFQNPARETAGGLLRIDLGALARNWRAVGARTSGAVGAVVKADAYGLGAGPVCAALHGAGCRDFFVAHLVEAQRLRPSLPADSRLILLNGIPPGGEAACRAAGTIPALNSLEQVAAWSAEAQSRGEELEAFLQLDTGMSRLGISGEEAALLVREPERLKGLRLLRIMSHLACSDEPENPQNARQLAEMRRLAALFPEVPVSFANSGGILLGPEWHGSLTRPGLALYGGRTTPDREIPVEPVVRLDLRVIQIRTVQAGARVGYGGVFVAPGETRLAVLSAGYADGLPRSLEGRGAVWFAGRRLPLAGRVSMDSLIVDASALPPGALKPGDLVEMIGPNQTLEEVAAAAGTINYEILTGLGGRFHRDYASG